MLNVPVLCLLISGPGSHFALNLLWLWIVLNSGKSNVWCLYPNKSAALKSVENAFGQEPVASDEVAPSEVLFKHYSDCCIFTCMINNMLVTLSMLKRFYLGMLMLVCLIVFQFTNVNGNRKGIFIKYPSPTTLDQ